MKFSTLAPGAQTEAHTQLHLRVPQPPRFPRRSLRARLFYAVALPWRLLRLLLTARTRALVVFDPRLSLLAWLPASLLGVPTILFLRSAPNMARRADRLGVIGRLHERLGMRLASTIVVTTAAMKDFLVKHAVANSDKLLVVPSGITYPRVITKVESGGEVSWVGSSEWEQWLDQFDERRRAVCERFNLNERSFLIATAGELTADKNIDSLVRGLGASELENVNLIVCGDGPESQRIFGMAVSYGLSEQVIMAGWMKDPVDVIAGCDLYVSPSESLDIPNSLMEALGAGIPILAGNTAAMREWLGYDELLYEHNHVGKLGGRLREVIRGRGVYDQIRRLSHQRGREIDTSWGEGIGRLIRQVP